MPTEDLGDANRPKSLHTAALYIGRMSAELARLARRHHLEPLAYILEMARLEAEQTAKSSADGPDASELA